MIREALFQDIPKIIALGKQAVGESRISEICSVDEPLAKAVLMSAISGPSSAVFVDTNVSGVIVGNIAPMYEVTDLNVVTHHLWYVAPGARPGTAMKLLDALHDWAGPTAIKRHLVHDMIVDPEKSRKLFERRGYRLAGYLYEKED